MYKSNVDYDIGERGLKDEKSMAIPELPTVRR